MKKKFLFSIALCAAVLCAALLPDFGLPKGARADYELNGGYYEIAEAEDWVALRDEFVNAEQAGFNYRLTGNIDLSGIEWEPIGWEQDGDTEPFPFTGEFDGGGFTISGLTVNVTGQSGGLFGVLASPANIHDLKLATPAVTVGGDLKYAGALTGKATNATIANVTVMGGTVTVTGEEAYAGGLAGDFQNCTVSNSIVKDVEVIAGGTYSSAGGFVCIFDSGSTFNNCSLIGDTNFSYDGTEPPGGVAYADLDAWAQAVMGKYASLGDPNNIDDDEQYLSIYCSYSSTIFAYSVERNRDPVDLETYKAALADMRQVYDAYTDGLSQAYTDLETRIQSFDSAVGEIEMLLSVCEIVKGGAWGTELTAVDTVTETDKEELEGFDVSFRKLYATSPDFGLNTDGEFVARIKSSSTAARTRIHNLYKTVDACLVRIDDVADEVQAFQDRYGNGLYNGKAAPTIADLDTYNIDKTDMAGLMAGTYSTTEKNYSGNLSARQIGLLNMWIGQCESAITIIEPIAAQYNTYKGRYDNPHDNPPAQWKLADYDTVNADKEGIEFFLDDYLQYLVETERDNLQAWSEACSDACSELAEPHEAFLLLDEYYDIWKTQYGSNFENANAGDAHAFEEAIDRVVTFLDNYSEYLDADGDETPEYRTDYWNIIKINLQIFLEDMSDAIVLYGRINDFLAVQLGDFADLAAAVPADLNAEILTIDALYAALEAAEREHYIPAALYADYGARKTKIADMTAAQSAYAAIVALHGELTAVYGADFKDAYAQSGHIADLTDLKNRIADYIGQGDGGWTGYIPADGLLISGLKNNLDGLLDQLNPLLEKYGAAADAFTDPDSPLYGKTIGNVTVDDAQGIAGILDLIDGLTESDKARLSGPESAEGTQLYVIAAQKTLLSDMRDKLSDVAAEWSGIDSWVDKGDLTLKIDLYGGAGGFGARLAALKEFETAYGAHLNGAQTDLLQSWTDKYQAAADALKTPYEKYYGSGGSAGYLAKYDGLSGMYADGGELSGMYVDGNGDLILLIDNCGAYYNDASGIAGYLAAYGAYLTDGQIALLTAWRGKCAAAAAEMHAAAAAYKSLNVIWLIVKTVCGGDLADIKPEQSYMLACYLEGVGNFYAGEDGKDWTAFLDPSQRTELDGRQELAQSVHDDLTAAEGVWALIAGTQSVFHTFDDLSGYEAAVGAARAAYVLLTDPQKAFLDKSPDGSGTYLSVLEGAEARSAALSASPAYQTYLSMLGALALAEPLTFENIGYFKTPGTGAAGEDFDFDYAAVADAVAGYGADDSGYITGSAYYPAFVGLRGKALDLRAAWGAYSVTAAKHAELTGRYGAAFAGAEADRAHIADLRALYALIRDYRFKADEQGVLELNEAWNLYLTAGELDLGALQGEVLSLCNALQAELDGAVAAAQAALTSQYGEYLAKKGDYSTAGWAQIGKLYYGGLNLIGGARNAAGADAEKAAAAEGMAAVLTQAREALNAEKAAQKQALTEYVNEHYNEGQNEWGEVNDILAAARGAIDAVADPDDIADIAGIAARAIADMAAIPTAELLAYKAAKKGVLEAHVDGLILTGKYIGEQDGRGEQALGALLTEYEGKIEAATSKTAVDGFVAQALSEFDSVPTKEREFAAHKEAKVTALTDAANGLKGSAGTYTPDGIESIDARLAAGIAAIRGVAYPGDEANAAELTAAYAAADGAYSAAAGAGADGLNGVLTAAGELAAYAAGKTGSGLYTSAKQGAIGDLVNAHTATLSGATSATDAKTKLEAAKSAIDNVSTMAQELAAHKATELAAVEGHGKSQAAYTDTGWAAIQDCIQGYKNAAALLNEVGTETKFNAAKAAVTEAKEAALAGIAAVPTKAAEDEAALTAYKSAKKDALGDRVTELKNSGKYIADTTGRGEQALGALLTEYEGKIEAAASKTAVDGFVAQALSEFDSVPTKEREFAAHKEAKVTALTDAANGLKGSAGTYTPDGIADIETRLAAGIAAIRGVAYPGDEADAGVLAAAYTAVDGAYNTAAGAGADGLNGVLTAVGELTAYAAAKKGSGLYTLANKGAIDSWVNTHTSTLNGATSATDAKTRLETAKSAIDGVQTMAQELAAHKATELAAVESHGKSQAAYTDTGWAAIQGYIQGYKNAAALLNEVGTETQFDAAKAAVTEAKEAALAGITAVPTKADEDEAALAARKLEAKTVYDKIGLIPSFTGIADLTDGKIDSVTAARAAYKAYNPDGDTALQGYVANYGDLTAAEAMITTLTAAKKVHEKIKDIPAFSGIADLTAGNTAAVSAARAAYSAYILTDGAALQGYVTNYGDLTAAEALITTLTAAKGLVSLIASLSAFSGIADLTPENRAAVSAAGAAYELYNEDGDAALQGYVTNYSDLTAAQGKITDLTAAEAVYYEIEELQGLTEIADLDGAKGTAVKGARANYNALGARQVYVTNLWKLTAAEGKAADLTAAKAVCIEIEALQNLTAIADLGGEKEVALNTARTHYNALGARQIYVTNAGKLAELSEQVAALTIIKNAVTALGDYKNTKVEGNYTPENWGALGGLVTKWTNLIAEADGETEVNTRLENAQRAIDAVETIAQQLQHTKNQAVQDLRNYADAKGEGNYSESKWPELQGLMTDGVGAITSAGADGVSGALQSAKLAIDAVKTLAVERLEAETAALNGARAAATAELDGYAAGLQAAQYEDADWADILLHLSVGRNAAGAAAGVGEAAAAVAGAKALVGAVPTKAARALTEKKNAAFEAVNSYDPEDYDGTENLSDRKTIADAKAAALGLLGIAATAEDVDAALAAFGKAVAGVPNSAGKTPVAPAVPLPGAEIPPTAVGAGIGVIAAVNLGLLWFGVIRPWLKRSRGKKYMG